MTPAASKPATSDDVPSPIAPATPHTAPSTAPVYTSPHINPSPEISPATKPTGPARPPADDKVQSGGWCCFCRKN